MSQQVPDPFATQDGAPASGRKRRFRMTRGRWVTVVVVALVLIAGTAAWTLLRPQSSEGQARTRTFTAQAEKSNQTVTVGLTGTLSPQTQSDLNFPVSGTVTKVYVSAGDVVKKGDKLARIDDNDLRDALALAQANLDTAEANLTDVNGNGSDAAVTAADAQVKSAKAAVSSAEDDLTNAVLRSPISGTVAAVDLTVGDTVSGNSSGSGMGGSGSSGDQTSSTAQVVVISTALWKLDGTVGSADLGNLKAGQAAVVTPAGGTDPIDGTVKSVGIVATSSSDGSATFPVVLALKGKHPELFSGTTASATITVGEYPDVLTVPTLAITTRDGKSVVTKVDGTATSEAEVTIGRVFGDATEITAGLSEGDTVQVSFTVPQRTSSSTNQGGGLFGGGGGRFEGPPNGAPPEGVKFEQQTNSSGGNR